MGKQSASLATFTRYIFCPMNISGFDVLSSDWGERFRRLTIPGNSPGTPPRAGALFCRLQWLDPVFLLVRADGFFPVDRTRKTPEVAPFILPFARWCGAAR